MSVYNWGLMFLLLALADPAAILVQTEAFVHQEKTGKRRWVALRDDPVKAQEAAGWVTGSPGTYSYA